MSTAQSASAVMMVRPTNFGFNEQTADTNSFQNRVKLDATELLKKANQEFDAMVAALGAQGIDVTVFENPDHSLVMPDAVFPNNWLSTWANGQVFLYPMAHESRRIERSSSAIQTLSQAFNISEVVDLSESENRGVYLESTGVIIFDYLHKIAYGCISPRCDEVLFTKHACELGFTPVVFHAYDRAGVAIYHTNVLMGIASTTAVICAEAITNLAERAMVVGSLTSTGHEVVQISYDQMASFCGNVLELRNDRGELFLAMSQTAYDMFTPEQRAILGRDKTLLPLNVTTIETVGGGSVRCMLGEVFLPRR